MKKIALSFSLLVSLSFGAEISGQGFLKTKGGDVKTCSGNQVYLEKYNKEDDTYVMNLVLYDLEKKILFEMLRNQCYTEIEIEDLKNKIIKRGKLMSSLDRKHIKETICDAQGNFEFYDIVPGKYIIGTTIEWMAGDEKQGGFKNAKFELSKKQNKMKVFITE